MSKLCSLPIVLIGGGGHAAVLVDILLKQGRDIIAVICPDDIHSRSAFTGLTHLTQDHDVLQFRPESVLLVNGIGMMPKSTVRKKVNEHFLSLGYQFETVISDDALVSPFAIIEAGAQIFPAAIVQAGTKIAAHCIINTGVLIEHDCYIGEYTHIAPKATLCGQVRIECGVFVGASVCIIQNISIGENSIIGAGFIVKHNCPEKSLLC